MYVPMTGDGVEFFSCMRMDGLDLFIYLFALVWDQLFSRLFCHGERSLL